MWLSSPGGGGTIPGFCGRGEKRSHVPGPLATGFQPVLGQEVGGIEVTLEERCWWGGWEVAHWPPWGEEVTGHTRVTGGLPEHEM